MELSCIWANMVNYVEITKQVSGRYTSNLKEIKLKLKQILVTLQVAVLLGIVQNLTHKSYFASYVFVETLILVQALTLD
jgi:hypothetical protein